MINDKLTKELQEQITENKNDIDKLYGIKYISGFEVTPTFDCYAEVSIIFSGWSYGGQSTSTSVNNTLGNAELIANVPSGLKGHDTVPDAGIVMAIYKLKAGTKYKFGITGMGGGNIAINGLIKLIPMK